MNLDITFCTSEKCKHKEKCLRHITVAMDYCRKSEHRNTVSASDFYKPKKVCRYKITKKED